MLLYDVAEARLTHREGLVLRDLLCLGRVSRQCLMNTLYGDDPGGGPLWAYSCLNHCIRALRRKLLPGWRIDTHFGWGYSLAREE